MVISSSLRSASYWKSSATLSFAERATENSVMASFGVSRPLFHSSKEKGLPKRTRVSSMKSSATVTDGSSWSEFEGNSARLESSYAQRGNNWGEKHPESNWKNFSETSSRIANEDEGRASSGRFGRNLWDRKKMRNERPMKREYEKREIRGTKAGNDTWESSVPKIIGEAVYGLGPVLAALSIKRRRFNSLYVQEGLDMTSNNKKKDKKGFERVMKMAESGGLIIKAISKHDLNMIVENRPHQGLVLDASPLEMVRITELEREGDKNSLWVALDEVKDPQNLGAIIRSCYFFGVAGMVVCAKNSAPLSGVVSKASAGSLELMELRYCRNMMQFLAASSENGWRVVGGSVSSRAAPVNDLTGGEPTILVLGSEGSGLRTLVEKSCTHLVRIPSKAIPMGENTEEMGSFVAVESLNVSVAAGVLLHHLSGSSVHHSISGGDAS